ncbi:hypothetical protein FE257_001884 [Aspergillus nanangensis]|uniref:Mitochondrial outer membrane transport complex Sam37/metaxin N-terminal domain-containing protein n=1 Tax=Aspergillus nanangensis TaxID=2582783 RepID=A0AAD4GPC4_ASPNN|nr:hypothetical protein FE257_001884 [Aspergillus nanangensis]
MVLELHVWGPAFSLPSIDAQCLATIAYLSLTVPKDAWVLVASSDPSVCPTNELPALKIGSTWISRFRNIVDYLRQYSNGEWDLDRGLTSEEKADNIAFSSFIESRAHPLLDLSLYVTSQNYYEATAPAYARILQWPNQWILPPQRHTAAKTLTEPLGLSSLDLSAIEEQRKRDVSAAVAAGQLPQSFLNKPHPSTTAGGISSFLGRNPHHQGQFRLEALTAELFEPLEEILAKDSSPPRTYLLGGAAAGGDEHPHSVDCVALGYLALALVPDVPYGWLRDAMRKNPRVMAYAERMRKTCFGDRAVEVADAYYYGRGSAALATATTGFPWQVPDRPSLVTVGWTVWNTVADAVPILRDLRVNNRLREAAQSPQSGLSGVESKTLAAYATGQKKDILVSVVAVVGGIAALVGYMVSAGTFSSGEEEEEEKEEYSGEEGEMMPLTEVDPESFQMGNILSSLEGMQEL